MRRSSARRGSAGVAALALDDVRLGRGRQALADLGAHRLAAAARTSGGPPADEQDVLGVGAQAHRRPVVAPGAPQLGRVVGLAGGDRRLDGGERAALQQRAGAGRRQQRAQVGQVGPAPDDRVDGGLGGGEVAALGEQQAAGCERGAGAAVATSAASAARSKAPTTTAASASPATISMPRRASSPASASSPPNRATRRGAGGARSSRRGPWRPRRRGRPARGARRRRRPAASGRCRSGAQAATSSRGVAGTVGHGAAAGAAGRRASGARSPRSANSRSRHFAANAALARA